MVMRMDGMMKKLRIIVPEDQIVYQRPLYEAIVIAAKKYKIAGATVLQGVLCYGSDNLSHSLKSFALSESKPMVIEFIDVKERLTDFSEIVAQLIDKAESGSIMYLEDVEVLKYS